MTIVAREPLSIWRYMAMIGVFQLGLVVILSLFAMVIVGGGFLCSIESILESDLPLRFMWYMVFSVPLIGLLMLYFARRERRWRWIVIRGQIDMFRDDILVRSLTSNDITRVIFHDTSIGVFTRNPSGYHQLRDLPRGSGLLVQQEYEEG